MVAGFDDGVEIDHSEPVYTEVRARSTLASPTIAIPSASTRMKMTGEISKKKARTVLLTKVFLI